MAKITKIEKQSNVTPAGIMPPEMLKRHGLTQYNSPGDRSYVRYRKDKKFKRSVELFKFYRLKYHNVLENHLASPLVLGLHFLVTPMARDFRDKSSEPRQTTNANNSTVVTPPEVMV